MIIKDYESGRILTDVCVELTRGEAEELMIYLQRMLIRDDLKQVYLTDLNHVGIQRELTVTLAA